AEAVMLHQGLAKKDAWDRAVEMLEKVKIPLARERVRDYPHQFSGGMRQRVMIAMAVACNPSVLIADEPTTALDVTIQAQILDMILDLKERLGTAVLLITHDLGVIAETAQRAIVMSAGRKVQEADTEPLFRNPLLRGRSRPSSRSPARRNTSLCIADCSRASSDRSSPSTACPSRSAPEKRYAWSASRAAERQRWPRP